MVIRLVRAVLGAALLLVGLPSLLAGGVLWFAMQHQDAAGGYRASLATVTTDGYAVVASDVDALLKREAPFARGGQTRLRLTAHTGTGPAFVGLARAAEVAQYLAGVRYLQLDQVRLARGPLPVSGSPVAGTGVPAAPGLQSFWLARSGSGSIEWSPHEVRGEQLALVVMDPRVQAPLTVDMTAHVRPAWIGTTTVALLVLGTTLVLVAVAALAWPSRSREIIYVVPPAQFPEIAAHLGVAVPRAAPGYEPGEPAVPLRSDGALPSQWLGSEAPAQATETAATAEPAAGPDQPRSPVPPPELEWPPPVPRGASDGVAEEVVDRSDGVAEEVVDRSGVPGGG
jgi:hypothetical protein